MSSAGSPRWASSQSITAAEPRFVDDEVAEPEVAVDEPRRRRAPGAFARSQRRPSSTAGSGSPISSSWRSHSSIWPTAGSAGGAGKTPSRRSRVDRVDPRQRLARAAPASRSRAASNSGLLQHPRRHRGALDERPSASRASRSAPPASSKAIGSGTGHAGLARELEQRELLAHRDERDRALRVAAQHAERALVGSRPLAPARSHARRRRGSGSSVSVAGVVAPLGEHGADPGRQLSGGLGRRCHHARAFPSLVGGP